MVEVRFPLFFATSPRGGSARKAELVSSVYENVRQAVKDKLGDRAKNYVMDIQLGDFDTKIKKVTNDSAEAIV